MTYPARVSMCVSNSQLHLKLTPSERSFTRSVMAKFLTFSLLFSHLENVFSWTFTQKLEGSLVGELGISGVSCFGGVL